MEQMEEWAPVLETINKKTTTTTAQRLSSQGDPATPQGGPESPPPFSNFTAYSSNEIKKEVSSPRHRHVVSLLSDSVDSDGSDEFHFGSKHMYMDLSASSSSSSPLLDDRSARGRRSSVHFDHMNCNAEDTANDFRNSEVGENGSVSSKNTSNDTNDMIKMDNKRSERDCTVFL